MQPSGSDLSWTYPRAGGAEPYAGDVASGTGGRLRLLIISFCYTRMIIKGLSYGKRPAMPQEKSMWTGKP